MEREKLFNINVVCKQHVYKQRNSSTIYGWGKYLCSDMLLLLGRCYFVNYKSVADFALCGTI